MATCLERGADLHMAQPMPLPLTVSCFSKIQIGFTFLYQLTWVVQVKGSLNVRACVCVRACMGAYVSVCACVYACVRVSHMVCKHTQQLRKLFNFRCKYEANYSQNSRLAEAESAPTYSPDAFLHWNLPHNTNVECCHPDFG